MCGILTDNLLSIIDSIKSAASQTAYGSMLWYSGNETGQIPGAFPDKWWEGSALFLSLLYYWHYTGDTTYNAEVSQGMEWQAGNGDYMPANYSSYLVWKVNSIHSSRSDRWLG